MDRFVDSTHVVRKVRYAPWGRIYSLACGSRHIGDVDIDGPLLGQGPACSKCFADAQAVTVAGA